MPTKPDSAIPMLRRRLPPLTALRAFEAGARHLSFTRAAEELFVTQAAISHQVRQLEEQVAVKLFRRRARHLELTPEGRMLYDVLHEAFDLIAEGVSILTPAVTSHALTVSTTPSFGSHWLAGRLGRFWQSHPDVDLRLHHSGALVDFTRDDVDLAVRFGSGVWPGLTAECLLPVDLVPVCSPALVAGEPPLGHPEDLARHVLLHEDDYALWTEWLKSAGIEGVNARRGPIIDDSATLLHAAMEGQGVVLGRVSLVRHALESGRLVMPFEHVLQVDFAYWVVYPEGALADPRIKAFRDWLFAEAAGAEGCAP